MRGGQEHISFGHVWRGCASTDVVMLLGAGRWGAPRLRWDDLCADVRPLVLRNLSLRELARVALTCREFHQEFSRRLAEERARLISIRERTLGEKMFTGFVTAFRHLMSDKDAYPALEFGECLSIDADGMIEYPVSEDVCERSFGVPRGVPRVHIMRFGPNWFHAQLVGGKPGILEFVVKITLKELKKGPMELWVEVNGEGAAVAAGFLLATCTGYSKGALARAQCVLDNCGVYTYAGYAGSFAQILWGVAEQGEAGGMRLFES
jgi:hypothetical protein